MTTRIFRAIGAAVYERASDRRRLLPGLAEPRRRAVRLPLEDAGRRLLLDCGPGVLASCASSRRLAARRRDRDHALAPRPLGRPRALGVGQPGSAPAGRRDRPELWLPPEAASGSATSGPASDWTTMFDQTLRRCTSTPTASRSRPPGFDVDARRVPTTTLLAFGFRASTNGAAARLLGRLGPDDALAELARDADLFVCEATLLAAEPGGEPRGHLCADEAVAAFDASGAKRLLLTHRPDELPLDERARARLRRDGRRDRLRGGAR